MRATAYEFATFAGYLREHADDDMVMILIGDHQPPAAVSGHGRPVGRARARHRRQAPFIDHLLQNGFARGVSPARPAIGALHGL